MSLTKSGNPTLQEKAFKIDPTYADYADGPMTLEGTLKKFGILFILLLASCFFAWNRFHEGGNPMSMVMIGGFGGLGVALVIVFKKQWSSYLAPAYALLEGLFVGSISALYDYMYRDSYPGIVMQAVLLTLVVTVVMYALYHFRIIKVTQKFRSVITIATISIVVFYLIQFVAFSIFKTQIGAFTMASTPLGIGFSVVVVCLAALNLLLDFDMIEQGTTQGAPKYMEWYASFGLIVTLVWLYLEILRLLSKLKD